MARTSESNHTKTRLIVGLCIALFTTILLLRLEAHFRPAALKGLYFQRWSSETMMQTVSIADLRDEPFRTLWNLHIQPPAFDTIRACLAHVWSSDDSMAMLWQVDRSLYILWALVYGMTGFIIFWWLSHMTGIVFAAASTLLFSVHPALIFYATFLDTTLLSAFLFLCLYYLLWRVKEGRVVSVGVLALSFLSLFFTRSIFQWQWVLLLSLSLALMKFPIRKVIMFLAITGIVVGLYTAKQIALFGQSSTSSFTGLNLCKSIGLAGARSQYILEFPPDQGPPSEKPNALSRHRKTNGSINFNHEHFLNVNRKMQQQYRRQLLSSAPLNIAKTYLGNLGIYLRPSSRYTDHVIVDCLPQRSAYDYVFSFPLLLLLLIMAFLSWMLRVRKSNIFATIGLCLPGIFIVFLCIIFERGENMRFKFFIEPVFFIFLASQVYAGSTELIESILTRLPKRQETAT